MSLSRKNEEKRAEIFVRKQEVQLVWQEFEVYCNICFWICSFFSLELYKKELFFKSLLFLYPSSLTSNSIARSGEQIIEHLRIEIHTCKGVCNP